MSNHSGSHMLNAVLSLLKDKYDLLNNMPQDKLVALLTDVIAIGDRYDCNEGEILHKLGQDLKFCYYCMKHQEDFPPNSDICTSCDQS
jgi:hypothetical protein